MTMMGDRVIHFKNFWEDYWAFITGAVAWFLLVCTCWAIPDEWSYSYAILWSGAGAISAGIFVAGYLLLSKPSKDPNTRKRSWSGTWVWLLTQAEIVMLVAGLTFVLRILNLDSVVYTDDRISQYRFTSAIFITVFVQQVWLLWLWIAQQVRTRRRIRVDSGSEHDPV